MYGSSIHLYTINTPVHLCVFTIVLMTKLINKACNLLWKGTRNIYNTCRKSQWHKYLECTKDYSDYYLYLN